MALLKVKCIDNQYAVGILTVGRNYTVKEVLGDGRYVLTKDDVGPIGNGQRGIPWLPSRFEVLDV